MADWNQLKRAVTIRIMTTEKWNRRWNRRVQRDKRFLGIGYTEQVAKLTINNRPERKAHEIKKIKIKKWGQQLGKLRMKMSSHKINSESSLIFFYSFIFILWGLHVHFPLLRPSTVHTQGLSCTGLISVLSSISTASTTCHREGWHHRELWKT